MEMMLTDEGEVAHGVNIVEKALQSSKSNPRSKASAPVFSLTDLYDGLIIGRRALQELILPSDLGVAFIPLGRDRVMLIMAPAVDCESISCRILAVKRSGSRVEHLIGKRFIKCFSKTCADNGMWCPIRADKRAK